MACSICRQEGHIKRNCNAPASAPKVKAKAPVKLEVNYSPWSEKSNGVPFKSSTPGVGDGEEKMSRELDTPIKGQNCPYDMAPILNGVKTKCDVKKLDKQNDFNTGKEGRNALRPIKSHHIKLIDSLHVFAESNLFTSQEKSKLVSLQDVSPDELAVGTLKELKEVCLMLKEKKKTLSTGLPTVPVTLFGQTKDVPLDIAYDTCQKMGLDLPSEFSPYLERILILQEMNHVHIDDPERLMYDLNSLVEKMFTDLKLIIVHEQKGYFFHDDIKRIKFYRITRGNPRFQLI